MDTLAREIHIAFIGSISKVFSFNLVPFRWVEIIRPTLADGNCSPTYLKDVVYREEYTKQKMLVHW